MKRHNRKRSAEKTKQRDQGNLHLLGRRRRRGKGKRVVTARRGKRGKGNRVARGRRRRQGKGNRVVTARGKRSKGKRVARGRWKMRKRTGAPQAESGNITDKQKRPQDRKESMTAGSRTGTEKIHEDGGEER